MNFQMLEEVCIHLRLRLLIDLKKLGDKVQSYLNAKFREEIIFTKSATEFN